MAGFHLDSHVLFYDGDLQKYCQKYWQKYPAACELR